MTTIVHGALFALLMALLAVMLSGCGADQYVGKWKLVSIEMRGQSQSTAAENKLFTINYYCMSCISSTLKTNDNI
jgi:cytochrome c biogenesis protein ResB